MNEQKLEIKLSFITGLKDIVLDEISKQVNFQVLREYGDSLYLSYVEDLSIIKRLRSVARAYVIVHDPKYNPLYIFNHKSILGSLVKTVIDNKGQDTFKTFKVTCAGSDSKEVNDINRYLNNTYDLIEKEEADIKIHIIKLEDIWEVGVQITSKPLSVRDYKIKNMRGAMDPTIAYAVNSLCGLDKANSYLNVFSGSATLLIEAAQCYSKLETLVGFDNNKKHISLAIQNIKKAGLIKKIQLKEIDIFDKPNTGKFDAITSDLPFGMSISKNEDLGKLYRQFVEYCQDVLTPYGNMVVYTSEYEIFGKALLGSEFRIIKQLELRFITSVNAYLRPKIFVCELRQN